MNHIDLPSPETIRAAQVEPMLLDIKQTAERLNTCTKTVRRLIVKGWFSPCKAVRKVLIPRKQVEEFLKKTCEQPRRLQ